jgi:hypothetical protein
MRNGQVLHPHTDVFFFSLLGGEQKEAVAGSDVESNRGPDQPTNQVLPNYTHLGN